MIYLLYAECRVQEVYTCGWCYWGLVGEMFPVSWSPRYVRSLWAHWPLGGKERYGQLFVTIRGTLQIRSLLSGQNCFGSRAPRLSFIAKKY